MLNRFTEPVPALTRHLLAVYHNQAVHGREWRGGGEAASSGGSLQLDQVLRDINLTVSKSTPKEEANCQQVKKYHRHSITVCF